MVSCSASMAGKWWEWGGATSSAAPWTALQIRQSWEPMCFPVLLSLSVNQSSVPSLGSPGRWLPFQEPGCVSIAAFSHTSDTAASSGLFGSSIPFAFFLLEHYRKPQMSLPADSAPLWIYLPLHILTDILIGLWVGGKETCGPTSLPELETQSGMA